MRMRILLLCCAALALTVGVATATAGNSATAKLCQKGGWMTVQGSDGTKFASETACVSYGAHGGSLVAIPPSPPTITVSFTPTFDANYCSVTVNLSHFTPLTPYTTDIYLNGGYYTSVPATTDSSGAASLVGLFSFYQHSGAFVAASVGSVGVGSGNQTVTC